jgi:AraC-like DNA-binding protein
MEMLGLNDRNFVVDVPSPEQMSALFESSHRKELYKNPLYDIAWCENIIRIIRIYAEQRQKQTTEESLIFTPVLTYMSENIDKSLHIDELAAMVYMQPTYFIKRFRKAFGLPPLAYFNRIKLRHAMGMLAGTDRPISEISASIGIGDSAYFSRLFRKHCGLSPAAYRAQFKRMNT